MWKSSFSTRRSTVDPLNLQKKLSKFCWTSSIKKFPDYVFGFRIVKEERKAPRIELNKL